MLDRPASLIELGAILDISDTGVDRAGDNTTGLCDRCQRFDIQSFAGSAGRRYGYALHDVEAAAADGCEFCTLLLDSVKDVERPTYFRATILGRRRPVNPDLYIHMTLSENYIKNNTQLGSSGLQVNRLLTEIGDRFTQQRNASEHELCLAADPTSPAAMNGDVTGRYRGSSPASEESYATLRNWIQDCSTHQKCNQTVSGSADIETSRSPLPTRCIEISEDGCKVSLRETEGTQGAYITLSYRWNPETERCKTTADNYRKRLGGDGFEKLPRLFQDVFLIATNLGVRYVWIDSICILQNGDNGVDWRREAPKMAQYYQFALLTIAGTLPDMRDGLLNPLSAKDTPWASKLVRLPYRDKANTQAGFFYVYRRRERLMDDYIASVRSSTLLRRGWVLQEWLLSKRLLWYTPRGLFFECHSDGPRTACQERIEFESLKSDIRSSILLKTSFHWTNTSILDFWYSTLEVYSACHLTMPNQDRILAMAGVAKEVGQILINPRQDAAMEEEVKNEVYLSGLWLYDIHRGLLWQEDQSSEPLCTARVDGAPSWSWASILAKVRWPERMQGTRGALQVTGVCLRKRERHTRPEYMIVGKKVYKRLDDDHQEEVASGVPRLVFDPTNMYSCMHIRGKLYTVHVRGYLETKENLDTAAISTAYDPNLTSRQWRAICAPSRPEIIAGWGSLEQLKQDPGTCTDFGFAVHALHVSTRYLQTGVLIKRADSVADVLLLEEIDSINCVYRRLGVGSIADGYLIEEFRKSTDQAIQLV